MVGRDARCLLPARDRDPQPPGGGRVFCVPAGFILGSRGLAARFSIGANVYR